MFSELLGLCKILKAYHEVQDFQDNLNFFTNYSNYIAKAFRDANKYHNLPLMDRNRMSKEV